MLEFKGREHEKEFQIFFAEQHLTWDLFVHSTFWLLSPTVLVKFWMNSHVRSPLWYATFIVFVFAGKAMPIFLISTHSRFYTRYRTGIVLGIRVMEMFVSRAYLCFWMEISDMNVFSDWVLLACVFPNSYLSAAIWGIVAPVPNLWWLNIQVIDLARLFAYNTTTLRQVEGGLHHLAPVVGAVNALITTLGMPAISARNLLFLMWLALEVFVAFLLPFWTTYTIQLRSRRLWRQVVLKRPRELQILEDDRGVMLSAAKDTGLDIRPTWALFLPESLAFLTLSYVAGQNFRLLQYMV